MIVLLSPAKTLDEERVNKAVAEGKKGVAHTRPAFSTEAEELVVELQKLPVGKLKTLLGVSDAIAKLNHGRYKEWSQQDEFAAATLFDGPAYRELKADTLTADEAKTAANRLRILCGLYGVLRPWDLIKPYRLDMSKKLANSEGKDLYAFWGPKLAEQIEKDLKSHPKNERFVVNCASQEYFAAVSKHLTSPIYQMQFPGPSVYAKQARGAMVRHIVVSGAKTVDGLKTFIGNNEEWTFSDAQSSDLELIFVRKQPKAAAGGSKKRKR